MVLFSSKFLSPSHICNFEGLKGPQGPNRTSFFFGENASRAKLFDLKTFGLKKYKFLKNKNDDLILHKRKNSNFLQSYFVKYHIICV
jgi:hypothetical protein